MPLSLGPVRGVGILGVAVAALLILQLSLQTLQVEVAQGIGAEAAGLEVAVGGDVRVLLQQVRDAGEDGGLDAIGVQALEQQERLEVGVGREASSHPPGVCSARAMGLGRDGSHGGERGVERATRAMGASGRESVADGRVAWFDEEIVANCRRGAIAAQPGPGRFATAPNGCPWRPPIRRVQPRCPERERGAQTARLCRERDLDATMAWIWNTDESCPSTVHHIEPRCRHFCCVDVSSAVAFIFRRARGLRRIQALLPKLHY